MISFTLNAYARRQLAPPPSDWVDVRVLGTASTAERHTIPAGASWVVFSGNADFYTKFGDNTVVAAVPAADVVDGTGSELNPEARQIPDGATSISLVSATAGAIVSLSFYGL